jgi:protein-tyrosine phosphatase
MLDLHSHILNGIDDGPASLEESLSLAVLYEQAGFSHVVATPHWIHGTAWMTKIEDIRRRVDQFNKTFQSNGIGIHMLPGMEIAMDMEIPSLLSRGELLPLADSPYLLIETPFQRMPSNWEHMFFTIQSKGYHIVLAHPERCAQIIASPEIMGKIIAAGVYIQSNYDSFLGNYGSKILETALYLLKKGHIHILATDSHDAVHRHPGNAVKAIQILKKEMDADTINLITRINPDRLINGLPLKNPAPIPVPAPGKGTGKKPWRLF